MVVSALALDVPLVELVRWPEEAHRRDVFARAGLARLLLVAPGEAPPADLGIDEDWVRLPADEADIRARAQRLRRAVDVLATRGAPYVDAHRVLHRAGAAVPLSAHEATIVEALLRTPGAVVTRAALDELAWNGRAPSKEAIDAAIYRLRRRLTGLGLTIRAVRNQGFALHAA